MSAPTTERDATSATVPVAGWRRRLGPRGMTWLVWRQHRATLVVVLVVTLAAVGWLWLLHHEVTALAGAHRPKGCEPSSTAHRCHAYIEHLRQHRYQLFTRIQYTETALLALPVLAGVFIGAPLLARDFESGTHRLVWTQSMSRRRWLATKFSLGLTIPVLGTLLPVPLTLWLWHAARRNRLGISWFEGRTFLTTGPPIVGLTLLALAVGVAAGALLRRTVATMATTLVVSGGLLLGLYDLQSHLMPVRTIVGTTRQLADTTGHAWVVAVGPATDAGRALPNGACSGKSGGFETCLEHLHATHKTWIAVHPASQRVPMQWVGFGLCAALAALLLGFAWWWVTRREA